VKKEEIDLICQEYDIKNYTINNDGSIDVYGNVDLYRKRLTELPLKFGKVTGYFTCLDNKITSLEGSPYWVGEDFSCTGNLLKTLNGCPIYVGGYFICDDNKITSLEGSPYWVGKDFSCTGNLLKTLNGCPDYVGGDFKCDYIDNEFVTIHEVYEFVTIHEVYCLLDHKSFIKQYKREQKLKELLND